MNKVVILAAGKGTRMQSELPKVLVPLHGRPMLAYFLTSVEQAAIDKEPILVVSPANQAVIKEKLSAFNFKTVVQAQQLGTGHAVKCAAEQINSQVGRVLVFNGDHPLISSETIKKLAAVETGIGMLTVELENYNDWRQAFYSWGRLIKSDGQVRAIREMKDADEATRAITELNTGMYSFDFEWLEQNIDKLVADNAQKEFYLTDLIKLAFDQKIKIATIALSPEEALGINSMAELEIAEKLMKNQIA